MKQRASLISLMALLVALMPGRAPAVCVTGDCRDGIGTYRYNNGDRYEGQFKKGRPHGHGTCRYSNGDRFSGNFVNGVIHGKGEYLFANGEKFSGTFNHGMMEHGTFAFTGGETYVGWFFNGRKHGDGVYTYTDGHYYRGRWENDLKSGPGSLYYRGRLVRREVWSRGRIISR